MERTAVNPWDWSLSMGFNQGEVVSGQERTLFCAGQTSVDADGMPVNHYTVLGNEYVARRLHEELAAIPEVASRLPAQPWARRN